MGDFFTIRSGVLPSTTRVAGFRGVESLSRPYTFDIFLLMTRGEGDDFDMADALSGKATLSIDREDGRPPFLFHGILSALELVHELGARSVFRATLVPQLWSLTQTRHSRIFTGESFPQILQEILEEDSLTSDDYTLRLLGDYPADEHICQYQESDFDFISRWMEYLGIYYFFEQGEDGERLIVTDDRSFHQPLLERPVRFHAQTGADVTAGESLRTFSCRHVSLPGSVRLADYDYARPQLDVSASATVSPTGVGELSTYGERFFSPAQAKKLAKIRSEELLARQVVTQGTGTALYLRPGYTFTLEDHPRPALNTTYLTTAIEHSGHLASGAPELQAILGIDHPDTYLAQVRAIPASSQFRAERRTSWPRIHGHENAVVDGPANSEYAQIDEHGRYAVKFHFDESSLRDGKASTWVRMLQPHGGAIEGWHFPLRKGTEVLCTFLGGDPDRPVVSGVAPNALTPSPVTSSNHTKNIIQSGGRNLIEMEDLAGSQRMTIYSPVKNTTVRMGQTHEDENNLVITTDGTGIIHTGDWMRFFVDNWKHEVVKSYVTEEYKGPMQTTVNLDVFETYEANKTETVASGHVEETYQSQKTTVTALRESDHGTEKTHVRGTVDETYDGKHTTTVTAGGRQEEVTGLYTQIAHNGEDLTVEGGLFHQTIKAGLTVDVTGDATETASATWTVRGTEATKIVGTKAVTIVGSATVDIGEKSIKVNGSEIVELTQGAAMIQITGGNVTVKGGTITVEGGTVNVTGSAALGLNGKPVNITGGDVNVTGGLIKLNC